MFKVRKKLPSVESVKEIFPLTSKLAKIKQARDTELKDILLPGAPSGKFILIVGPCSAHCIDATLAYCYEIAKIADKVKDKLFIVPRIFTSKSRSGLGYKGLVHGGLSHGFSNSEFTSHDTGGFGMVEGVLNQREVHYRVLAETGLSGADELVYLDLFEYIADLVSYVSIGARASDSQSHRLFASGLNTPVGIKNNLAGRLDYLNYALDVAHSPQEFSAGGYAVKSKGNKLAHAVLRGYIDSAGNHMPNYALDTVLKLIEQQVNSKHQNNNINNNQLINNIESGRATSIIIDASHSNSKKVAKNQIAVVGNIIANIKSNTTYKNTVKGIMLESFIEGGQDKAAKTFGKSVTDDCLNLQDTKNLILKLADNI